MPCASIQSVKGLNPRGIPDWIDFPCAGVEPGIVAFVGPSSTVTSPRRASRGRA